MTPGFWCGKTEGAGWKHRIFVTERRSSSMTRAIIRPCIGPFHGDLRWTSRRVLRRLPTLLSVHPGDTKSLGHVRLGRGRALHHPRLLLRPAGLPARSWTRSLLAVSTWPMRRRRHSPSLATLARVCAKLREIPRFRMACSTINLTTSLYYCAAVYAVTRLDAERDTTK